MFKALQDWIVQTSMTTGLGDFELATDPPVGTSYFPFRHRYADGATVATYWVTNDNPTAKRTKWEKYRGETLTYGTLDELTRANIEASTNSDGKINWQSSDLPLLIYIVPDIDAHEFAVTMGLGTSRPDVLRYGPWADEDGHATDFDLLNFFDGNSDDPIGVVNRTAHRATLYGLPPGYLYGLTLSRSSATVLGVAAGIAMDSTNVVGIKLASAFTKSTAGAWTSGTGNNGMGNSLTIANDTTYHVFEILNAGVADVYFDTSVSAANKPTNTTHFRRIGSFRTNGSAQIIDFVQDGDEFMLKVAVLDISAANPGASAVTRTLASIPTGVRVQAIVTAGIITSADGGASVGLLTDLSQTDTVPSSSGVFNYGGLVAENTVAGSSLLVSPLRVFTNTSAQVRSRQDGSTADTSLRIVTHGWVDRRGRDG